MRFITTVLFFSLLSCQAKVNQSPMETTETTENPEKIELSNPISIHSINIEGSDGQEIHLSDFKGKKILIVNTASECGYTSQYKELEELYQTNKDKLVIIAIPTNDFGGQEPGSNDEIKLFCKKNYGVSFPIAAKLTTKGSTISPIFNFLCLKSNNGVSDATIDWNFNKFLIDENGNWIAYFHSSTSPLSEEILSKI